ncbi:glycoside hydrolase family 15 protein [Tautonia sociabilis]|uniref:Glycoside hydrolase family 15 protein n=1 Tax=Tautonia sociabilis TaxID=2080755 RepID=A0A432ML63_9BACT|nr:glycoside hydrolase family 15 protein [Tautonia sociabilis]RUL87947.1 glycoside hydrolase family 15 protein [Tautonia sociabilis]
MAVISNLERFLPYPPVEQHGVIGDRRTAALVAADGTIDWLCLPDYDGPSLFGALLDAERGGYWRVGPPGPVSGRQRYLGESGALLTSWSSGDHELELTDVMAWPGDRSSDEGRRAVIRRLSATRGDSPAVLGIWPRVDFDRPIACEPASGGLVLHLAEHNLGLWASGSVEPTEGGACGSFHLREGEEFWAVLVLGETPDRWSVDRARDAMEEAIRYWTGWLDGLTYIGPRRERVRRTALTVHLLGYAPQGSLVAAPTTSLPARIGGDQNWDYRYAWVRDASLSLAVLALLGDTEMARRYMDWLSGLGSSTDAPLQVLYGIRGEADLTERSRADLEGYRGSRPVRFGNHAYNQVQLDSLGYFNDCALVYLEQGGRWREEYWRLASRVAQHVARTWTRPDHGIWELDRQRHYVSSKVMAWVALERASRIAERIGREDEAAAWRPVMEAIHAEVMDRGWSEPLGAFRQHYDGEGLDASALLIPVMGFLPADHPRVLATTERIVERLVIDGFVYRFEPRETLGPAAQPLGDHEGSFLPCTFWLATAYAKAGRANDADAVLDRAEGVTGQHGLLAEGFDPLSGAVRGNSPLLFSHVEYVRAVVETAKARPLDKARLMVGRMKERVTKSLGLGD